MTEPHDHAHPHHHHHDGGVHAHDGPHDGPHAHDGSHCAPGGAGDCADDHAALTGQAQDCGSGHCDDHGATSS
ncbi:hypothetical protein ACIBIZ_50125 [Nonomuraea spiralis]|uniref:hypothetical protein n=1 Tax=Nonomuraea TaxID=83681 RepID=UPI00163CD9FD|nr:hypothetical protein [Nonomuraea sp. WAC 01424]